MELKGGCYCGKVRYRFDGDPVWFGQCHCRACQYFTVGGANFALAVPSRGFAYEKGAVKEFARSDLETPRVRAFCPDCGTHLTTQPPGVDFIIIKVGTLDDPAPLGQPAIAIHCAEKQPFHVIAEGVAQFEMRP